MPSIRCVLIFHTTCFFCDSRMSNVQHRIASGSGKYIRLGLNGAERTTIIVDIFNTVQKVRDTGINLKVDDYLFLPLQII